MNQPTSVFVEVVSRADSSRLRKIAADTYINDQYLQTVTDMLVKDQIVLFAARSGESFVGRVSLWLAPATEDVPRTKLPGVPLVNALEVQPDHRRAGVATKLMDALELEAVRRGYSRLALGVEPDNHTAIALYEKRSFTMTGDTYESCWDEPNENGDVKRVCVDTALMVKKLI